MRRPGNEEKTLRQIEQWRSVCPDLALRSTFIVGYPGETEEDFQYLLDWMKEAKIERAGCFKYEPVEGAKSNAITDQISDEVKEERWHRFMQAQAKVSADVLSSRVGRTSDVIIDEIDHEHGEAIARSKWDAPEIDGNVFIENAAHLNAGDIVSVKFTASEEYDLIAELT